MLAYLAVEADRPHQRRKLAALLWPDLPESTALGNLRYALSNLRKVIGDRLAQPAYLEINPQDIRFNRSSHSQVDVCLFESYCKLANQNPLDFLSLENVAELYLGRFLEGFAIPDSYAFEEWVLLKREHLDRLAIQVFQLLANDHELSAEYQQAIQLAERQLELDPWREEAHRRLMRCFYFSGQRSAALAQYEACRRVLAKELSVEPESETRQLYTQILEGKLSPSPQPPSFLRYTVSSQMDRSRFVSRHEPLKRLHLSLSQAIAGQGQIMLVMGSPGQGKTALVQEFIRQALHEYPGLAAAWGNSRAYFGSGDPYLPFREIMEMLTGQVEHRWEAGSITREHALRMWRLAAYTIRALVQEGPALIGTFIAGQALLQRAFLLTKTEPSWLSSLRLLVDHQAGRPPPPQHDLFQQYWRVLASIAKQVPLVLFVDDLQWVDQSSLTLLFHLSRELKNARLLIIGAFRPQENLSSSSGGTPSLVTMVNELRLLHGDIVINLDEQEERSFIDAILDLEPNRLEESFRQDLFRFTDGHPLFTTEMLLGMRERGDLTKNTEGEWVISPSLRWDKLPPKVEAMIAERLRHLPQSLKDLLQMACIEGECFTAEVVAKVLGVDEQQILTQLGAELDHHYRLVQADSTQRINGTSISRYRFRHILFQRYLYNQMNLIERAQKHELVGSFIEEFYSGSLEDIALQLAYHYELAGLTLKAVAFLNMAGRKATRLSSFEDAIVHLRRALALLEFQPESSGKNLQELQLLNSINVPLMLARGYASQELGSVCSRMSQLLKIVPMGSEMFPMIVELCSYYTMRAEYRKALEITPQARQIAKSSKDEFGIHFVDFGVGLTSVWLGEIKAALRHFEQMIEFYDLVKHGDMHNSIGSDPGIDSLTWASWTVWLLGYPERALTYSNRAVEIGLALKDPGCETMSQVLSIFLRVLMKDITGVAGLIKSCSALLSQHPLPLHFSDLEFGKGYYNVLNGDVEIGLAGMIRGVEAYQSIGSRMGLSMHLVPLAEAHLRNGQLEQVAQILEQTQEFIEESGERIYQAEVLRVKGEMYLRQRPANAEEAEHLFYQALHVAHEQEAKTLELRAAMSLAHLRMGQGRLLEAYQVLGDVYNWFTEGFDTPDLRAARALLDKLN